MGRPWRFLDPTRIDECLFASNAGDAKCTRFSVSLCENPECGVSIDYIEGATYKLITNEIPVKEFNELLDELR